MKKLCQLLNIESDDLLFEFFTGNLKDKLTRWDYYVNWSKVLKNRSQFELELNILNYLIGKNNIEQETISLIKKHPEIIRAFPILLAIRNRSINVLIDTENFIYKNYNFIKRDLSDSECKELANFLISSGLGDLLKDRKIKNLVDYVTGVEVGLDSNGRKNRGGSLMETIVETFVSETCNELGIDYIAQATANKIKAKWDINVEVDKSLRQIDFAINYHGKLYFVEVNFYGGGGSKLKSTATEYSKMNEYWNNQNIEFIWVTDGYGWKSAFKPLREYFDKAEYLLNLEMLKNGILTKIFQE